MNKFPEKIEIKVKDDGDAIIVFGSNDNATNEGYLLKPEVQINLIKTLLSICNEDDLEVFRIFIGKILSGEVDAELAKSKSNLH